MTKKRGTVFVAVLISFSLVVLTVICAHYYKNPVTPLSKFEYLEVVSVGVTNIREGGDDFRHYTSENAEKLVKALRNADVKCFIDLTHKNVVGGGPPFQSCVVFSDGSMHEFSYHYSPGNNKYMLIIDGNRYTCNPESVEAMHQISFAQLQIFLEEDRAAESNH